jgi:penicillin-binding protein 2
LPLQLVMAYAAIGNGGTLYKPQVVRRIEDGDGHLLRTIDPVVVSRLQVPPKNLAAVVDGLKAVVGEQGGTAYWIRFSLAKELKTLTEQKIPIAGKTGTAQVIAIGEKRIKENDLEFAQRDHAWFVAFAPADQPEIAIVVLNEHGGHGGTASAPAAFKILEKYFSLKAEEAAVRNALPPPPEQPPPPPPPAKDGDDKAPAGHPREAQQRALPLPQEARWS